MAQSRVLKTLIRLNKRKTTLSTRFYTSEVAKKSIDPASGESAYERGVPFLYLPHTVQKAYHVHWCSTSLPKVFDKYKWLTKTISSPGLPNNYICKTNNEAYSTINESLVQAGGFQKLPRNRNNVRYFNERIIYSFFANILQKLPQLLDNNYLLDASNSLVYYKPQLETHWPRNYKFYHAEFQPTYVLKSRLCLDQVETLRELSPEEVESIPGPYSTYALNVYEKGINHLRNRPGMDNARYNNIKHCHTSIMVNNKLRVDEEIYAGGVLACFAQAVSTAINDGALFGTDLTSPYVTQCIVTNGRKISFFVYQLNTLNLMDDKGIWNRIWYTQLEDIVNNDNGGIGQFYETAGRDEKEILNNAVSDYFTLFLGGNTTCN